LPTPRKTFPAAATPAFATVARDPSYTILVMSTGFMVDPSQIIDITPGELRPSSRREVPN